MNAQKLGFVGLGVMGAPMAGHLAAAGHELTVFDIDRSKGDRLASMHVGVTAAANAREVAERSDIVVTMLPSGEYVRDAALGTDGLVQGFSGGELVVDTSSSEPWLTLETAAQLAESKVAMVDAPTSGAEMGAIAAELVFMVGGSAADVERAGVVLDAMGTQVFRLGPLGAGHSMKSINNLITAMTFLATAEGLALGKRMGLDPNVMTDVLNVCTGMSWISQTHFKQRITNRAFDDPFKLELMVKDIRIALGLADDEDIPMPLAKVGQELYELADEAAGPGASVSELVRFVEKAAGVVIS
jgi:3-hydroxyisobutyrate dehydrogenase-like beta-hydroxyacid dehydrogenase